MNYPDRVDQIVIVVLACVPLAMLVLSAVFSFGKWIDDSLIERRIRIADSARKKGVILHVGDLIEYPGGAMDIPGWLIDLNGAEPYGYLQSGQWHVAGYTKQELREIYRHRADWNS